MDIMFDGKDIKTFIDEDLANYKKVCLDTINTHITNTDKAVQVERNGKKINTTEYKMVYTLGEINKVYPNLLAEVKKHPEFWGEFFTKVEKVVEHFKTSEDYKLFNIKIEDIDKTLEDIKKTKTEALDIKNLDEKEYNEMFEEMTNDLDILKSDPNLKFLNDIKLTTTYRISKDNKIDSFDNTIEIAPFENIKPIKLTVDIVFIPEFTIPTLDGEKIFNMSKLIRISENNNQSEYIDSHPEFIQNYKTLLEDSITFATESETIKYIYDLMNKNGLEKEAKQLETQIQAGKAAFELIDIEKMLKNQN